jgi:peptide/nickel transport system permease protein
LDVITYILRRALLAVLVLFSVVSITFVLTRSIGANPVAAWLGKAASLHPELAALYAEKYHLNSPIIVQYYYYVVNLFRGDLGYSPSRGFAPVSQVIGETLPYTAQIVFFAFLISLLLGVILGVLSARYRRTAIDHGIRGFYLAGISSPPFFIALFLLIVFAVQLGILPTGGAVDSAMSRPPSITSIPMLDSLLRGNVAYLASSVKHVLLPSMALALGVFGIVTRILRSTMLDVMRANYIRTARAKGLDERTVFFKHGLRNAMIPVVTISSLMLTWLLTGTIFVENIFAYPGIGQYVVTALSAQDYPGILGTTFTFALIIVISNLVADILYAVVDPQIRLL